MPRETFETIISELDHEEDWRRMRATSTCMKGGPKAVEAVIAAAEALTHFGAAAKTPLLQLLKTTQNDNLRRHVLESLSHLGWRPGQIRL